MCGICGKINFQQQNLINPLELKRMTDSIVYRGPDDEGFYLYQNIGLGFRRLSIIDLATGHQPVSNEDETIWVILNGEIYNFIELRDMLKRKGHIFKTKTDTETVIHLYEEYGVECVRQLRGMFAFALWDNKSKRLFCARDRFGKKPFYYYLDNDKMVFGSEIKIILQSEGISKDIDFGGLDCYFAYGYITHNKSIYKHIKKLMPAHGMILDLKNGPKLTIKRYWDISFEADFSRKEADWIEEIESTLSQAVKMRMISDVPLGAFLSGGIDSSSVVALMCRHSSNRVKTFSMGFKKEKFNELPFAREIAKKYNTEHYEQIVEPESINLLTKLVTAFDEPFFDSSAIPTYFVSKFAREHVTVVLSGDGGDELFAGYDSYKKMQKIHHFNFRSPAVNKYLWGSIHGVMPEKVAGKGLTYFLSKNRDKIGAYFCLWTRRERENLFHKDILDLTRNDPAEKYKLNLIATSQTTDFLSQMQELDMRCYLPDDVLTKVDRVSMQNSLEVRAPILDHKFAELSFRIPSKLKLKGHQQKYIFKKAMAKYLPANVMGHKKQGFAVPLSYWFKDELKEYILDTLCSSNPLLSSYLNSRYIKKTVQNHFSGMRDFSGKLWSLLFFNEWLCQYRSLNKNL